MRKMSQLRCAKAGIAYSSAKTDKMIYHYLATELWTFVLNSREDYSLLRH